MHLFYDRLSMLAFGWKVETVDSLYNVLSPVQPTVTAGPVVTDTTIRL